MNSTAPVIRFQELDSTNAEAIRRAASGERGPVWFVADRQSAGRGRCGRPWQSPGGNLAATLLFEPGCPPIALPQLALVAGVAVTNAFRRLDPSERLAGLQLKWPNDILIGDAKVSGILIESSTFDNTVVAAVGIGVNVAEAPAMPDGRSVTSLADRGLDITSPEIFEFVANGMDAALTDWDRGRGFATIRARWLDLAPRIGARLMVRNGSETVYGTFLGLGEDGALLLMASDNTVRSFAYGDVAAHDEPVEREFYERGAVTGDGTN